MTDIKDIFIRGEKGQEIISLFLMRYWYITIPLISGLCYLIYKWIYRGEKDD
jgi:hypothetical protein